MGTGTGPDDPRPDDEPRSLFTAIEFVVLLGIALVAIVKTVIGWELW